MTVSLDFCKDVRSYRVLEDCSRRSSYCFPIQLKTRCVSGHCGGPKPPYCSSKGATPSDRARRLRVGLSAKTTEMAEYPPTHDNMKKSRFGGPRSRSKVVF